MYLYKGFTACENIALNLAAVFAMGVAYFPMEWGCGDDCRKVSAHGVCAVMMFVCLFYVTWFRAQDTLGLIGDQARQDAYRRTYHLAALVMLVSPLTAVVLQTVFVAPGAYVYFVELAGIWAFAFYWLVKSKEMRESQAEKKALRMQPCSSMPS